MICKLPSSALSSWPGAFHPVVYYTAASWNSGALPFSRQRDQPEPGRSQVPSLYLIHTCVAGTRASSRNLTSAVLLAARFAWEHARPEIGYLITRCLVALLPYPHSSSRLTSRARLRRLSHARKWSRISDLIYIHFELKNLAQWFYLKKKFKKIASSIGEIELGIFDVQILKKIYFRI